MALALGLLVHVATYLPGTFVGSGLTAEILVYLALHAACFLLGFIAFKKEAGEGGDGSAERGPHLLRVLLTFTMYYAMANFFICIFTIFVTGTVRHSLAEKRLMLRLASGHWQVLFLSTALAFLYPPAGPPRPGRLPKAPHDREETPGKGT